MNLLELRYTRRLRIPPPIVDAGPALGFSGTRTRARLAENPQGVNS
ncbi:MAG: hypothetical protein IPO90_07745 [Flavobacteriales bacterium]|nr:hypothetical protein [Flavobacteriales bacterium]